MLEDIEIIQDKYKMLGGGATRRAAKHLRAGLERRVPCVYSCTCSNMFCISVAGFCVYIHIYVATCLLSLLINPTILRCIADRCGIEKGQTSDSTDCKRGRGSLILSYDITTSNKVHSMQLLASL